MRLGDQRALRADPGRFLGMAYVPPDHAAPGTEIGIDMRGQRARARIVRRPFYTLLTRRSRQEADAMAYSDRPDCLYTENHEWVRVEDGVAMSGISDYAQDQLTDIVYVELPEMGATFEKGDTFAVVESVKAASDVYLPVARRDRRDQLGLEDTPEVVNNDPYGDRLVRPHQAIADADQVDSLMDPDAYAAYLTKRWARSHDLRPPHRLRTARHAGAHRRRVL